jgi:hypothetical protein
MQVGDLVRRRGWIPTRVGVITAILCQDEYRILDIVVHVGDRREEWDAEEAEVINESW